MEYGYFDSNRREYAVTRPDTPAPWANYLGSPEYGAIITNNAGGYSFAKSGANGRLLRYCFNRDDRPGRYVYIRDDEDGDFWSVSWQPAAKPLDAAKYECRHGLGYTALSADYCGIRAEAVYFVPLGAEHEVWRVTIENNGECERGLSAFGYAEFTNEGNYEQDQVNLQYTQFITRTYFEGSYIRQTINENDFRGSGGYSPVPRFFGISGAAVASVSGDREAFLGLYGGYSRPDGVVKGDCGGAMNYGGNCCGALQTRLTLKPGEKRSFCFTLGQKNPVEAARVVERYEAPGAAESELAALKEHWAQRLSAFRAETPDKAFNEMVNTWNAYQCFTTFIWSRAASLTYCGLRNGYGYRDTVQDIQGVIHLAPEMAAEKLRFMLSAQVDHGGALPLVKFSHSPGREDTPEDASYVKETGHPSYRADDALWLFPTVWKYIAESGDEAFLDETIPYANKGGDTVYGHLLKAIDFSLAHAGVHGLPAGLHADWNDCLRLGANGVSAFVAFQLYLAFDITGRFARRKGDADTSGKMKALAEKLGGLIEKYCWGGDRFIRGISEKGEAVGAADNKEANFWLNPQAWAVISGYDRGERARRVLDLAYEKLNTPYGVKLFTPPLKEHPFEGALALLFNPGMKENAGVFLQTQGWAVLAEALMNNGGRAFEYYKESCPAAQNAAAGIRKLEPYAYGQFTESSDSPNAGRSHVHWLTGTASTVMVGCVEGILGLRPDMDGLTISPAVPGEWEGFTMFKMFRGKRLNITVKRSGKARLTLNGAELPGNYIPAARLEDDNRIALEL
jgi:cellobiose phosphorylase